MSIENEYVFSAFIVFLVWTVRVKFPESQRAFPWVTPSENVSPAGINVIEPEGRMAVERPDMEIVELESKEMSAINEIVRRFAAPGTGVLWLMILVGKLPTASEFWQCVENISTTAHTAQIFMISVCGYWKLGFNLRYYAACRSNGTRDLSACFFCCCHSAHCAESLRRYFKTEEW